MKRICVFAGSSSGARREYRAVARELGSELARRRIGLVYGGARVGFMGVLADEVLAAQGHVIGIIPEALVAKEAWGQLGLHRKPCGLLNVQGYFDRLLSFVGHSIEEGFVRREYGTMIRVSSSPAELLDMLSAYKAPSVEKWLDRAGDERASRCR